MTALDLRPVEGALVIDEMQKVNSAYARSNAGNYVQRGEILYADKRRTIPLLRSMGLQSRPIELQRYGSMGSISYNKHECQYSGVLFIKCFNVCSRIRNSFAVQMRNKSQPRQSTNPSPGAARYTATDSSGSI